MSLTLSSDELRAAIAVAKRLAPVPDDVPAVGKPRRGPGNPPIGSLDTSWDIMNMFMFSASMSVSCRIIGHDMT